eukprot:298104-Chlamydomonas_euryale.AAC.1
MSTGQQLPPAVAPAEAACHSAPTPQPAPAPMHWVIPADAGIAGRSPTPSHPQPSGPPARSSPPPARPSAPHAPKAVPASAVAPTAAERPLMND